MKKYRFEAAIEAGARGGAFVRVPFDVHDAFDTKGQVKVKAMFDKTTYRGSLAPMGGGVHVLGIRKDIRAEIGKNIGDTVKVSLERDGDVRSVEVPSELQKALRQSRLQKSFAEWSYTRRREAAQTVSGAKKEETRHRRIEKILAELGEV